MSKTLRRLPKEEKMNDRNEKILKEISTLLLSLTGFPGDSRDKAPRSNDFGISFEDDKIFISY